MSVPKAPFPKCLPENEKQSVIMKIPNLFSAVVVVMLVVSCASPPFTEYQGSSELPGHGGTVRTVKGVDLWVNGKPQRECHIIGVIEDQDQSDASLARAARKHGGNVLIRGGVDRFGNVDMQMRKRWLVAKYVD